MKAMIQKLENIKTFNKSETLYKFLRKNGVELKSNCCDTEIYQIGKRAYSIDTRSETGWTVWFNKYETRQIRLAELNKIAEQLKREYEEDIKK